jgi:Domain of unknown function (DU1801)
MQRGILARPGSHHCSAHTRTMLGAEPNPSTRKWVNAGIRRAALPCPALHQGRQRLGPVLRHPAFGEPTLENRAGNWAAVPLSYRLAGVQLTPEVEHWFAEKKPPAAPAMRRVLDVVLGADDRLASYIKYGSLLMGFEGDLAAFVQADKKRVNVMFNRGARIKGDFPRLEGTGPSARFMRFADVAEVDARTDELAAVAKAWCRLVEGQPG